MRKARITELDNAATNSPIPTVARAVTTHTSIAAQSGPTLSNPNTDATRKVSERPRMPTRTWAG